MLSETSKQERAIFLLKFTEELIRHSKGIELYRLEEIVRKRLGLPSPTIKEIKIIQKEDVEEKIKELLERRSENLKEEIQKETINLSKQNKESFIPRPTEQKRIFLKVPEPMFPERQNYLKSNLENENLNFGKIKILINDPNVELIECPGENKKTIVGGKMGRKPTGIELTKEEIKDVLNEFSKSSKIPLNNGINQINIGNLNLTAIISDEESHFTIKKLKENSQFNIKIPRPQN